MEGVLFLVEILRVAPKIVGRFLVLKKKKPTEKRANDGRVPRLEEQE
jgi:hypothetical protein